MTENYKSRIIDFIEGRTEPEAFFSWFESDPQILDWLQSMIRQPNFLFTNEGVRVE